MGSRSLALRWDRIFVWILVVLIAGFIWLIACIPWPVETLARSGLSAVGSVGPLAIALLVALGMAMIGVRSHRQAALPRVVSEEPLLLKPRLPACPRKPLLLISGTEAMSGSTSLAFNLAVALAVQGVVHGETGPRRPRPVCLLAEGQLTRALGLRPEALEEYLAENSHRIGGEVVNLASRHASGLELFSLKPDGRAIDYLGRLVAKLNQLYDGVVLEVPVGDRYTIDSMAELADAFLLASGVGSESPQQWAQRVWSLKLEAKTVLVRNRVHPSDPNPDWLREWFLYCVELPDEPRAAVLDERAIPWVLDHRLAAARQFVTAQKQLWPGLLEEVESDAA